jgi:hypothetical protein
MTNFDDLISELNDFGKYQKLRHTLVSFSMVIGPIITYVASFTGANPSHRCSNIFNSNDSYLDGVSFYYNQSSNTNYTFNKCEIEIETRSINGTTFKEIQKCNEWVFDKTYYQTTITEDVTQMRNRFNI